MAEPKAYKGKLADFKLDTRNLNRHTQRGRGMVEASQRQRGFGRPGFAAKDKTMLGGNLSILEVAADIDLGNGEIFVVETDGDIPIVHVRRDIEPGTEEAVLLAAEDNQSALISIDFDPEMLAEEMAQGIDFGGIFTEDEQAGILAKLKIDEPPEDAGPQIDKAEELRQKWGVELGQLWALGEHRLICGDCTDKAVVDRVMGVELADLFLTDPPYGVGVEKWDKFNKMELLSFTKHWLSLLRKYVNPKKYNAFAFFIASLLQEIIHLISSEFDYKQTLIWHYANTIGGGGYRKSSEFKFTSTYQPIVFFGNKEIMNSEYNRFDVIVEATPQSNFLEGRSHIYQKPLNVIKKLVSFGCGENELVLDFFLGSGTTLIACQDLNRKCRAIEIDPGYVAVTLERFKTTFGIEPELVSNA